MTRPLIRTAPILLVGAALAVTAGSCKNLGLRGEPEELTVEVEAAGASSVTVVTSTEWAFVNDPACDPAQQQCDQVLRVLSADTASYAAPFKRTYRFTNSFRYLVEAFPTGDVAATLSLKILIDGKSWYADSRALPAPDASGERETLLFTYVWQEPRIQ